MSVYKIPITRGGGVYSTIYTLSKSVGASNNISLDTLTPTTTSIRIGDTIIDRLYTIAIVTSNSSSNSFTAVTIQAGEFETVNGTVMAEYAHRAILDGNANNIANTYANKGAQNIWTAEQKFNAGFTALNGNFSFSNTANIGMEIGRRDGTAGTPYIDFHTDGSSSTDYNSRLLATGNQLQVTASGGFSVNGKNIEIFDSVVDSGNAVTITAPASGDTIQAPDNGWFCLGLHATASGFVNFRQKQEDGKDRWGVVNLVLNFNSGWPCFYLPVKSGDLVNVTWSNATVNRLQFIRTTSLRDV